MKISLDKGAFPVYSMLAKQKHTFLICLYV